MPDTYSSVHSRPNAISNYQATQTVDPAASYTGRRWLTVEDAVSQSSIVHPDRHTLSNTTSQTPHSADRTATETDRKSSVATTLSKIDASKTSQTPQTVDPNSTETVRKSSVASILSNASKTSQTPQTVDRMATEAARKSSVAAILSEIDASKTSHSTIDQPRRHTYTEIYVGTTTPNQSPQTVDRTASQSAQKFSVASTLSKHSQQTKSTQTVHHATSATSRKLSVQSAMLQPTVVQPKRYTSSLHSALGRTTTAESPHVSTVSASRAGDIAQVSFVLVKHFIVYIMYTH